MRLKKKLSIKHLRVSWHNKMAELRHMTLLRGSHFKHCCVCIAQGSRILNAVIRDVEHRITKALFTFKMSRGSAVHA